MASLSDQIDRLSHNTRQIQGTTTQIAPLLGKTHPTRLRVAGPFTRAVLNTELGDLIRDIDPAELGLFSLITPVNNSRDLDVRRAPPQEITISHAEFSGASPLRKTTSRRENVSKSKEIEPEIYAKAALKYIDWYQPMRPMPRAHSQVIDILERLDAARRNVQALTERLQQIQATEITIPTAEDEEKRIQELRFYVVGLKKRKQAAIARQKAPHTKNKTLKEKPMTAVNEPPSSPNEANFWGAPETSARILKFTDNLMEEDVDLNDITTTSFMSLTPLITRLNENACSDAISKATLTEVRPDNAPLNMSPSSIQGNLWGREEHEKPPKGTLISEDMVNNEQKKTAVIRKTLATIIPPSPEDEGPELSTYDVNLAEMTSTTKPKIKINSEVERIVKRIWLTCGDLIMPGHPFDLTDSGKNLSRPPGAKETIAHLQLLSDMSPTSDSPSAASVSAVSIAKEIQASPTSQQTLTAHLLLYLLSSPPQHSSPLSKVKEHLVSKAKSGPNSVVSGQSIIRIVYGCVAKRLVRIERGGGEQIVGFDV